jgi:alginate O-acetyltransferase complex protein AlgI
LWRSATGQDVSLANPADLSWLGFSYLAFRLIHTLRDRQAGILPPLSLRDFSTYVLFFPAYVAGPIDRAERFAADLQAMPAIPGLDPGRIFTGSRRLFAGLVKKFVLADTLAIGLSLSSATLGQAQAPAGLWLLLYGYAFRLYFDFSGYTDIAVGLAILYGVRLPENFARPYWQSNITAFWQSWHITLSRWARFYVFTPLSRWLLRREPRPSAWLTVLAAHLATMVVIGLWHGFTLNFFFWGLWHALALFGHKVWSDRTRRWYSGLSQRPYRRFAWTLGGWFLTFHYVALSWVWFALPTPVEAGRAYLRLFGFGW